MTEPIIFVVQETDKWIFWTKNRSPQLPVIVLDLTEQLTDETLPSCKIPSLSYHASCEEAFDNGWIYSNL